MEKIRELLTHKNKKTRSMQMTISISFTILSVCCMCLLGVMLYQQFTRKAENLTVENSRQLLNQTTINLEDYLRNMRRISDAMYYTVIKNTDIGSESLEVFYEFFCTRRTRISWSVWHVIQMTGS